MRKPLLVSATALLAAVVCPALLASPASAAENLNRTSFTLDPADHVEWTCADGSTIGLGFDIVRNTHDYYDSSGNLVLERRNVNFTGYFQNMASGERYTFRGTKNATLDFVDNTYKSTGDYRTVTMPHAGVVMHDAGITIEALDIDGLVYKSAGPKYDEEALGSTAVCSLFGLQGA